MSPTSYLTAPPRIRGLSLLRNASLVKLAPKVLAPLTLLSSLGKSKRVLNHWIEQYHASLSPPAEDRMVYPQQM